MKKIKLRDDDLHINQGVLTCLIVEGFSINLSFSCRNYFVDERSC